MQFHRDFNKYRWYAHIDLGLTWTLAFWLSLKVPSIEIGFLVGRFCIGRYGPDDWDEIGHFTKGNE